MALFEHQPYTNFENINLDMILADIKTIKENEASLDSRVDALEASYTTINENITNIQTDITNIYEQIGEIDLTALEARMDAVEADCLVLHNSLNNVLTRLMNDETQIETNTTNIGTNDLASVNRDNALSARISALERATVHDIYNYYADGNQLLFGSDLRNIPSSCKKLNYPIGYGNKSNKPFGDGDDERLFVYTDGGFQLNSSIGESTYDYYQFGVVANNFGNRTFTLTLAITGSSGNPTPTWLKHTFADATEAWQIGTDCYIGFTATDATLDADFPNMMKMELKGRRDKWVNVLGSNKIIFAYLEYGTGSVDITASYKPLYEAKDRLPFIGMPEPTIPSMVFIGQSKRLFDIPAYYIDSVGEQVSYYLPVASMGVYLWFDNSKHSWTGYCPINVRPTSESRSATQIDGLTERGCYVDAQIDVPSQFANLISPNSACQTYDGSTFDMVKNINVQGSFLMKTSEEASNKMHIKIQSSGFAIDGSVMQIGSIPLNGYSLVAITGFS